MKRKSSKLLVLLLFVVLFVGSAIYMYKKFVEPSSDYNTEIELRGTGK